MGREDGARAATFTEYAIQQNTLQSICTGEGWIFMNH